MADPPKFTIRRLNPDKEPRKQTTVTPKIEPQNSKKPPSTKKQSKPNPQPQTVLSTGGLFRSANSVLAFLGSVFGTRLAETALVRRTPKGTWWAEIAIKHERISPLIWTAGGRPFARSNQHWVPLSLSGELPPQEADTETIDVDSWSIVELAQLLAAASLPSNRYRGATVLEVIAPGSLGRWILRRATALGLEVTLTPALRQPLHNHSQDPSGVLLIRLQSHHRPIPAALVHRLTSLPYTIVAAPSVDTNRERILVDVRQRLSLASSLIEPMIPQNEIWVLGTADVGNWKLQVKGNQVDGSLLLDAPELLQAQSPQLPAFQPPKPIPVLLVPRPSPGKQADAILVDDKELSWLRTLLMGRPIGEMAFILPGAGYHLLTAPGGLPTQIPLGIPLVCIGPGAIYLELGMDFYPSLPDAARQQRFNLNDHTAVAVAHQQTYHFDTAQIIPSWTLWVGEIPTVKKGLSAEGKKLLKSISQQLQQEAVKPSREKKVSFREHQPLKPRKEVGLLEQAQQEELKGDLVKAAALLEKAGYAGQAGRLYERIAMGGK